MRALLAGSLLTAAAIAGGCDRTYQIVDAGSPGDAPPVDAAPVPDDGPTIDAPAIDGGRPADRSGRITLLEIEPMPGFVLLAMTARFADHPLAAIRPECVVEREIEGCRRTRCPRETTRGSAGTISAEVDGTGVLSTIELAPGLHQGESMGTGARPGASIAIVAPGADVPGFRIDAIMPRPFAPMLPQTRIPGSPLRIEVPPAGTDLAVVSIVGMADPSPSVTCSVPGDAGVVTIAPELLDAWPGPETLQLTVAAVDLHRASAPPYDLEAYVGRASFGPLTLGP